MSVCECVCVVCVRARARVCVVSRKEILFLSCPLGRQRKKLPENVGQLPYVEGQMHTICGLTALLIPHFLFESIYQLTKSFSFYLLLRMHC
jgi:hypothetical protein